MKKEVSVLIDRDGNIWVDIGTSGEVRLAPAFGSIASPAMASYSSFFGICEFYR